MTDFKENEDELAVLERRFLDALRSKDGGNIDKAEDELREILGVEPRLAEPRMELARILLETNRVEDAEVHAREALERLVAGGQWTDDLPEDVLQALCHALLAEILRRRADEDGVIFGGPQIFRDLVKESQEHFQRAAALDPSDEYSSYYAFFMGASRGAEEE
ncbi:MAG: hypothetical protein JRI25_07550 [Deltaproteobacteria bacterium]|nr:hypothetical protein [Deltaproteobacteria bacterium]MBW2254437.1 hypothetical protein [Deltaproteobacteria bacterium]